MGASIAPEWFAFLTTWLLSAGLLLAGASQQIRLYSRGPGFAAALIAAFVLQLGLFWLPGFSGLRTRLEATLEQRARMLALGGALLLPWLVYAAGTGVFGLVPLLKLLGLAAVVLGVYGLFPPRVAGGAPATGFAWQDALVMAAIAAP